MRRRSKGAQGRGRAADRGLARSLLVIVLVVLLVVLLVLVLVLLLLRTLPRKDDKGERKTRTRHFVHIDGHVKRVDAVVIDDALRQRERQREREGRGRREDEGEEGKTPQQWDKKGFN